MVTRTARRALAIALCATALFIGTSCGGGPAAPTPVAKIDTFIGTLQPLGADFKTFTISYTLGTSDLSITVNSLVTAAASTPVTGITIGVGVGTVTGAICSLQVQNAAAPIGQELFAPNGALVDSITFGAQTNNISEGRSPDGGAELRYFTKATPGASNAPAFSMGAPTLDQAGNVSIVWQTQIGETYRIQYKRDLSEATWTDLPDVTATGTTTQKLESLSTDAMRFYRILKVTP